MLSTVLMATLPEVRVIPDRSPRTPPDADDFPTVCAIGSLAFMIGDVLHEGLGHAATALFTVSPNGMLSTVAWRSAYDSKLVEAGGTIVNLISAAVFWMLLRLARRSSVRTRFFLFLGCAFNLFTGTGYLFFSGVTNFGDWAVVIDGMPHHGLWRAGLVVLGMAAYLGAVLIIGTSMVKEVGVPLSDSRRYSRLAYTSYLSSVLISCAAGAMNVLGLKYVLLSALPATAGADCGFLWMRYYVPRSTQPLVNIAGIRRSWRWIGVSVPLALAFIFVLGRGIMLQR